MERMLWTNVETNGETLLSLIVNYATWMKPPVVEQLKELDSCFFNVFEGIREQIK